MHISKIISSSFLNMKKTIVFHEIAASVHEGLIKDDDGMPDHLKLTPGTIENIVSNSKWK